MRTVREIGEFGLIGRLARLLPKAPYVVEGIGDDCAVVRVGDRLLLVTSDLFIEDVHFRKRHATAEDIGWKAAASAMSDIAAMGGSPLFCLVSLACQEDTSAQWVEDLYQGISNVLSRFGAVVVGGDTTSTVGPLTVDVFVAGLAVSNRYLRRKGAQAGDLLMVTGLPGLSAAGFHALEHGVAAEALARAHRQPRPRIPEGQWLCAHPAVHAMIDVSDGLAQDAGHLADASGLGVNLHASQLPISSELQDYCTMQLLDPRQFVLTGGEDYELAFAMSPGQHERTLEDFHHEFRTDISIIGEFTDQWQGVRLDGKEADLDGFDHFA